MERLDQVVSDSFGLWISGLFSSVSGHYPELSFSQKGNLFFQVVERLLNEGKIKFIAPGADCYVSPSNPHPSLTINDEAAHWNVGVPDIIAFLKKMWPVDVNSEDDIDWIVYFYELPGVIWLTSDGGG